MEKWNGSYNIWGAIAIKGNKENHVETTTFGGYRKQFHRAIQGFRGAISGRLLFLESWFRV